MALTVGELNAVLSVDDQAMDPGLRRAERALRQSGQRMGDDAERAGQQAGEGLGEGLVRGADGRLRNARGQFVRAGTQAAQGFVRGADGQWRNMRGELVDEVTAAGLEAEAAARRAGQRAGDALGDGLADGAGEGADEAVQQAGGKLEKLKVGAAAVGAVAGAVLMTAMTDALEQSQITARMGAQLGKTPAEAKRYGKIAGQLFAGAVTEDFQGAADTIRATAGAGLFPPKATNAQLESIATKAADVANAFEVDVSMAAQAAGIAVKTGLAKDSTEAFDMITKGMSGLGPAGEDFLETINEYGVQFAKSGLSGRTAMGMMRQAIQAGWKDTDKLADVFKELELRVTGGGKAQVDALKSVGLNADKMITEVSAGGERGEKAMGKIIAAIVKLGPKSNTAKKAIQDLFGGPGEDLGSAFFQLNMDKAKKSMDDLDGSADKLGNTLRDNAGTKVEAFKRSLQQGVVDFLGGPVLGTVSKAKNALGGIWDDAGKGGQKGVDRVIGFFSLLGKRVKEKVVNDLGPKVVSGLSEAGEKVAAWVLANPTKVLKIAAIAAAITMAIVMLPTLVAFALQAAAVTMVVGFVSRLISALAENVPKWWDSFTGWVSDRASEAGTWMAGLGVAIGAWFSGLWSKYVSGPVSRQWAAFLKTVQELPARTVIALASLAGRLSEAASRGWQSFRDSASRKTDAMIAWVKGIPGRITKGVGNLESLLVTKGRNVVQGLWSGIQSMGGWIESKILGWAKSVIPGPIAKALGIASPSKVTKAQGRWIARGLVDGLTGSQKQIKAASGKLSDIIADSLKPGKKRSKALATLSAGTKKLLALASQEERVATRLKAAEKKYADLVKARDALAADVKKGILDSANITSQSGSEGNSAESILDGLRASTRRAQEFAASLAKLRKSGVRSDLIAQIAQAGVDQGSSAAAALAKASPAQVKAINSQQAALVKAAGAAGSTAGDAMYGAGIQAAAGLVRGLQSQQKAIDSQMAKIAKSMAASIRKALGIKSPSRVMALVGRYTAQGLVKGVDAERSAVNASMASLVDTPAPGQWAAGTGPAASGRAQGPRVYTLRSDGSAHMDYVLGELRKKISNLGGDVQFVLGSGR
ncbi:phage tail tape measure protein [Streptomyces antibioticus]|uniref:phage tail tape measure protein n=1 Tax=Streptomyces antibioticus TaxID=1890 RepID=UPI003718C709